MRKPSLNAVRTRRSPDVSREMRGGRGRSKKLALVAGS